MSCPSIDDCIYKNLERYFVDLAGQPARDLYAMVLSAAEKPLLEVVMKQANGNQSIAAVMLGINRNTLHKKLRSYGLLPTETS